MTGSLYQPTTLGMHEMIKTNGCWDRTCALHDCNYLKADGRAAHKAASHTAVLGLNLGADNRWQSKQITVQQSGCSAAKYIIT